MLASRRWCHGPVLLLLIGLAGCAGGGRGDQAVSKPPAATRLAYIADDNHVYTVALEGADPSRVDSIPGEPPVAGEVRVSRWPTWTADGSRLAFMRLRSGEGGAAGSAAIWTVAPDGSDLRKIWESQDLVPIYMSWAPDASALALLAQDPNAFQLLLVDPSGSQTPRKVAEGSPLFSAWSADGTKLLIHVGGDHRRNGAASLAVQSSTTDERTVLGLNPADFRAPVWSPDTTRIGAVVEGPGGSAVLTVASAEGGDAVRLAPLAEEGAFLWAPGGENLAFSTRLPPERIFYQGLEVVKSDGSGRSQVTQDAVMAFFWSPDGKKLAYAAVDRRAQALAWFVGDATGKNAKQVAQFLPSEEQIRQFAFFDQYAQSHGLWSPDSRYLLYAGTDGPAAKPSSPRRSRVFVVPADGSTEPKAVADGAFAAWPVGSPVAR